MKPNQCKCHLLISQHKYKSLWENIGSSKICESNHQNFLESTLTASYSSAVIFWSSQISWQKTKCINQNLQIQEY